MITVQLTEEELAILGRQETETKNDGGWQNLLVRLQEAVDPETRDITITDEMLEKIGRYAFGYGNGGWEGRLTGVFSRTLGPRLDGNLGDV